MNKQDNHEANTQSESLTDLPVANEQADETRGGQGGPVRETRRDFAIWSEVFAG